MRPVGKRVSLLSVLYSVVKLTWRYGALLLGSVATKSTKPQNITLHPQLLTRHRAMHNASHGGTASYLADTVD